MKKLKLNAISLRPDQVLTRMEMKSITGGLYYLTKNCGEDAANGCCNAYCGTGSPIECSGTCSHCVDAGNGNNPNVPGGDKLCAISG